MGYTVTSLTLTKDYVLANGAALFIAYAVFHHLIKINYICQIFVMACY